MRRESTVYEREEQSETIQENIRLKGERGLLGRKLGRQGVTGKEDMERDREETWKTGRDSSKGMYTVRIVGYCW